MSRPAYGTAWRKVRAHVLARDRWRCQIRLEGICTGQATEVDHLDPVALNGYSYDLDRLRASCAPCNHHLGGKVSAMKARIAADAIFVGPSRQW
jgi:5-methylcytosine-specific restriction endonuclease McrA